MKSGPGMELIIEMFIIFLGLLFAGFSSAIEKAVEEAKRDNIKSLVHEGNKKAIKVTEFSKEKNKMYATTLMVHCTVLITMSAIIVKNHFQDLAAWFVRNGEKYLHFGGEEFFTVISLIVLIVFAAFIFLVFGVFYPRQVALQKPEKIALRLAGYGTVSTRFFSAMTFIVSMGTNLILKITGQNKGNYNQVFSQDSVMSMLEVGQESGELKEEGKKMISSIFDFDDKLAYEIMTARTDVFMIYIDDEPEEYMDALMELRYSRIPVCREESDNIIGILNIKDYLIKAREEGFDNVDIESILRKPYFVPETKNIDSLFFELQREKQHIAILIDEYGGFSGIVTMEDIIEEIMGDIDDEFDYDDPQIQKIEDNIYIIEGRVALADINEEINLDLDSETSETIGGYIMDMMGEIPDDISELEDDKKEYTQGRYKFTVVELEDRHIEKVKLEIMPNPIEEDDNTEQ